ncbi:hypothetical protein BDW62DRAFT_194921 [Aspergillus aurantiobrunneus]
MLELPEDFDHLDKDKQTSVEEEVTKSRILYLYDKYTAERNPILSRVSRYSNAPTLADPFRFAGST